ncbi:aminotransferase class V-fold PLP-dependent enzyme [Pseudomonadales bacterium]|nr:aminotransferase class V-fold PLP-dependent enzyme [Pseudomonadales bacterium]MDB4068819.1 aminotransferase class V-fold PLP-dependent enzyme [Pseudomonadales bacterium]MDB9879469.1 aminotransferase class V-fold PLP-dependent enzyme [Pseudomonadales bacterium]MDB9942766.1 aminotransferase class V-fold PLP-dependent enzyme [Pseudomonadales bacterium]MDC0013763.1 aminotransferase class V-fold PLP-dependent enzyme [Pseudomonadales bacterium]
MTDLQDFEQSLMTALRAAVTFRDEAPAIPAFPASSATELRARFDIPLDDSGRPGPAVISDLIDAAKGGLAGNTQPNFYAWVQGSSHPTGVAADLLTSAWGQNAGLYQTAPAAAIAEEVASKWLLDLLHLPATASVAFTTGATMANFIGLAVARSEVLRRIGYDLEMEGMIGAPHVTIIVGAEAHSTVMADLRHLGFGTRHLVIITSDAQGRMSVADLADQLAKISGPIILVAQAGHINSGSFDPFNEIIPLAHEHGAWVHVDGAFGLWANAVEPLRQLSQGVELADSWSVDGHKWLQVPYDAGFGIVRDAEAHQRVMSITASYLTAGADDGRSPSAYVPELSRRARGFAVWATLQALGRQGVRDMVLRHCQCATHLAARLSEVAGIHVLNDVVLNQVAIAFGHNGPDDEVTKAIIDHLQEENRHFVLSARWRSHTILRISIISMLTQIVDIDSLADGIIRAWQGQNQALSGR